MKNPFYWMGISLIITGIFLSFLLPYIMTTFPDTQRWVKPLLIIYHVAGLLFGVYITWYIYVTDF